MALYAFIALCSCLFLLVAESYKFEAESWLQLYDGLDDDFEEFWYSDDLWDTKTSLIASDGTQFEKQCNAFIQLCVCKDTSTGTMHECRETAASSAQTSDWYANDKLDYYYDNEYASDDEDDNNIQRYSARFNNYFDNEYAYDGYDNSDNYNDNNEMSDLLDIDFIGEALSQAYDEDYGSYSDNEADALSRHFGAMAEDYRDDAEYYYFQDYNEENDDYSDNENYDELYDDMESYLDAALGEELESALDDYLANDFAAYRDLDDYEDYDESYDDESFDNSYANAYDQRFSVRQRDYYDDLFDEQMQDEEKLQNLVSRLHERDNQLQGLIQELQEKNDELDERMHGW